MRQGRSYTPLSHIQVCPHQPVLSLIMQPQTCTSHTVTQLMRRSSLPRNSCEFSKSIRKSYLFCTFIWDRTSWSKLRNTPAALIGSFRSWKTRKWEREWEALFFMRWGKDFYNRRILEVTLDHKIWGHGIVLVICASSWLPLFLSSALSSSSASQPIPLSFWVHILSPFLGFHTYAVSKSNFPKSD